MYGRASLVHSSHEAEQTVTKAFRILRQKVRERFSREPSPLDHLGGKNPEDRLRILDDVDWDLENWPKTGTSFEDLDISLSSDLYPPPRYKSNLRRL